MSSASDPQFPSLIRSGSGSAPSQHTHVYPAISPDALVSSMQGRVVLVTGAGRGIGRAIALSFARAGAAGIALLSRTATELQSLAAEIASAYPETQTLVCVVDVADRDALSSALKDVERELGVVNVAVANAGVNAIRPFVYTPGEDWWRVIEVNLRAPMMLAEMVLPGMRGRNEGVIIFNASRAGIVNTPGASSYSVSKTALVRACAVLQLELDMEAGGTSGIHTYAIHPGGVRSDMTLNALHSDINKMQPGFTDRMQRWYETAFIHPPELSGQTCVYLATGRASALRGRYIDVGEDIEDLVRQADLIRERNLYDLGVRKLGEPMMNEQWDS